MRDPVNSGVAGEDRGPGWHGAVAAKGLRRATVRRSMRTSWTLRCEPPRAARVNQACGGVQVK